MPAAHRLARGLRGHARIVCSPTCAAVLLVVSAVIAVRGRNAVGLVESSDGATELAVAGAFRIALLQLTTMVGIGLAAFVSATLSGVLSSGRDERLSATLEASAAARWGLRALTVFCFLLVTVSVAGVATVLVGLVQAERIGAGVRLTGGGWEGVTALVAPAVLVAAAFSAIAVLLAAALAGSPAVVVGAATGGTLALLLLEHLLGERGGQLVPTAWVARFLQLPARDYGVAYFWTTGANGVGRAAAGLLVAAVAVGAALAGWAVVRSAGRA